MLQALLDNLPHGSGIDSKWRYSLHEKSIRLYNAYHCMNDAGYYDGWADFVVIVPKDAFLRGWYRTISNSFDLQFQGKDSQYLARKYFLRDYLEDTFAEFFRGL